MCFAVGQIADPIVGQLRDVGFFERRALFDLHAQAGEEFGRHADQGHVADQDHLQNGFALFALLGLELEPRLAKDPRAHVEHAGGVLRAIVDHFFVFGRFVERADLEAKRPLDRGDARDRRGLGLLDSLGDVAFQFFDGVGHRAVHVVGRARGPFQKTDRRAHFSSSAWAASP